MADQIPFSAPTFADPRLVENPESRCPVVLLLDNSGSMQGAPLAELNAGLVALKDSLASDQLAMKRVELAIVSFGPVKTVQEFISPDVWTPPTLVAEGDTPIGEAINRGLDLLEARKAELRAAGNNPYRPWVFLITDGGPNPSDPWQAAATRVHEGEVGKKFMFFGVGVQGANMDILGKICPPTRAPMQLKGLAFKSLFLWLSSSLRSVSASKNTDKVTLVDPRKGDEGWASTT